MGDNRQFGGFRWLRNHYAPNSTTPPIEIKPVADDYGTAIYIGSPVKQVSTGYFEAAAAGDTIYGVCVGVEQYYDGSAIRKGGRLPASTSYDTNLERQSKIRVIPVRGQVFQICADDKTTATTEAGYLAFRGENCEWVAGTAVGDHDGALLDISTHATTNTLSLRLIEPVVRPDLDYAGLYVPWAVMFNLIQDIGSGSTTGT
jgi:hypothetical protein